MNLTDILSELGKAKEAMDALPDARRKIDDLEFNNMTKQHIIDDRNAELSNATARIEELSSKLRQVEEERDQYGFRAMEADEKLEKVLALVRPQSVQAGTEVAQANTQDTAQANENKPETAQASTDNPQPFVPVHPSHYACQADKEADVSSGQSVEHPTVSSTQAAPSPAVQTTSAEKREVADASPSSGPYAGRKYYDKPETMSWHDWTQGGGEAAPWMS